MRLLRSPVWCVQVFWARHQELPDWEKVIKNIERGEQKIQRQADIMQAVRSKLERYKNPWQELKVCIDTCVCKTMDNRLEPNRRAGGGGAGGALPCTGPTPTTAAGGE